MKAVSDTHMGIFSAGKFVSRLKDYQKNVKQEILPHYCFPLNGDFVTVSGLEIVQKLAVMHSSRFILTIAP
jgi:hypothetical protein